MISWIRHLNQNNFIVFFSLFAVLYSCGKEPEKIEYVAKVNNAYLTEAELSSIIDTSGLSSLYRDELIRNWIHRELLFQQAEDEGILDEERFNQVVKNSKKQLAASLLLSRLYENEEPEFSEGEIESYFDRNKNFFRLSGNAFLINSAVFKEEKIAVDFRSEAIEKGWNEALSLLDENSALNESETGKVLFEYEINPVNYLKVIRELYPGEISIILTDSLNNFSVIQKIEMYEEGTIPPLEIIKNQVKNRLLYEKKESLINDYIKELYSNSDIDVKQTGVK